MAMSFFFMDHPLVGGYTPDKVALRRAIGLAFDNHAYIQHVLGGFGLPAQSTVPPFTSGYDPAYRSEMSEYSPARAKALLDLHGYVDRNGDGWREQPDGRPLVLSMAGTSTLQDRRKDEVWERCMTAVGLKMSFDRSTWPELLKKSRAGTLMMWGYSWSAASPDGGFFLSIAYGPNAGEPTTRASRCRRSTACSSASACCPTAPSARR
jgi:ABC-type transport system substrate-binding protein